MIAGVVFQLLFCLFSFHFIKSLHLPKINFMGSFGHRGVFNGYCMFIPYGTGNLGEVNFFVGKCTLVICLLFW